MSRVSKKWRRGDALLLALTLLWDAYLVLFIAGVVLVAALLVAGGEPVLPTPTQFIVIAVLQISMLLLGVGLLVIYAVDAHRNPAFDCAPDQRVVWILLIVFAGPVAMPWYWLRFIRGAPQRVPTPAAPSAGSPPPGAGRDRP